MQWTAFFCSSLIRDVLHDLGSEMGATDGDQASQRNDTIEGGRGGKALAMSSGKLCRDSKSYIGSLTSLTWGLAMLQSKLPTTMTRTILSVSQAALPVMGGQAISNIIWALCRMNVRPSAHWIQLFMDNYFKGMHTFKAGQTFSNTIWALANWQVNPGDVWLSHFVRCATSTIPSLNPDELAVILQGLADLEYKPQKVFHKQYSSTSPQTTVTMLWATSRLLQVKHHHQRTSLHRQQPLLQADEADSEPLMSEETNVSHSHTATPPYYSGPGRAWIKFYHPILQDLCTVVASGMKQLPVPQLVDALVALADIGFYPGPVWLAEHEGCCSAYVMQLTAYQVTLLSRAMDKMAELSGGKSSSDLTLGKELEDLILPEDY
ncbi:hypothetical protein CEUSTIGMA_g2596.t1 [Chlamydomonas eustigma]|uniref:Uncharacterized protein n=1 Tax=Chlamydomonas eustigma TaxID=1157962 RepID=A0A250WX03_9CHLO|nr:hypothetical protein CEUSTIGMA_g2596.t1 [Chlamydomonas eustigma]|eukprot:GAX75152.1 hypothetical protein CEUSTIGMA_g2596.t1 [Chlamydomonas eustigma]